MSDRMSNRANRRREYLEGLGWWVASRTFTGQDRIPLAAARWRGDWHAIDLETGRWVRLDDSTRRRSWCDLLEMCTGDRFGGRQLCDWIHECLAAGFIYDDWPCEGVPELGNAMTLWNGQRHLLVANTCTIVAPGFVDRTLDDYRPAAAPRPAPGPQRPASREFVSMRERPPVLTGRNVQLGLFE